MQVYGIESVITGVKTTCFFSLQNGISDGAKETCEEGHMEGENVKEVMRWSLNLGGKTFRQ